MSWGMMVEPRLSSSLKMKALCPPDVVIYSYSSLSHCWEGILAVWRPLQFTLLQCGWGSIRPHTTGHGTCLPHNPGVGRCWQLASFQTFSSMLQSLGVKSQTLEPDCLGWNLGTLQLVCAHGHVPAHRGHSLLAYQPPVVSLRTE